MDALLAAEVSQDLQPASMSSGLAGDTRDGSFEGLLIDNSQGPRVLSILLIVSSLLNDHEYSDGESWPPVARDENQFHPADLP
jgi:hypothetical protein